MSVETYNCSHCGAKLGITGPGIGSDDDLAAEDYFESEVEYHETAQCTHPRAEFIAGLRALADLLVGDPELPLPDLFDVNWYLFGTDYETGEKRFTDEEQKARAADLVRRLPGDQRKSETGELFRFHGTIHGLRTQVIVDRSAVCRRVVTGTREVTETVPAPDAPTVEVTRTVEDVEWICEPLLAGAVA